MKPAEIERFVRENVADSLAQSIDDGLKATALEALQKLVREEAVPADLLETVVPYLESEMQDAGSIVRTEVFHTVAVLGRKKFDLVRGIFPDFFGDLRGENRFRARIILDFLADLSTSQVPEVRGAIEQVLDGDYKYFLSSHLRPVLVDFFKRVTNHGFQFERQFGAKLTQFVEGLPGELEEVGEIIADYRARYGQFKAAEERRREEEQRRREEARKRRAEAQKRLEGVREKGEGERGQSPAGRRPESVGEGVAGGEVGAPAGPGEGSGPDRGAVDLPVAAGESDLNPASVGESRWSTFSDFGLRRREVDEDEDSAEDSGDDGDVQR
ncbi:MAG: hypothetical protein ACTSU5_18210 [Promethearchaeota archaeon]